MSDFSPHELAEFGIDESTQIQANGSSPNKKGEPLLAQSVLAEKGVLCAFLNSPTQIGALCVEKNVGNDHFFIPAHAMMFEVLMALWETRQRIDFIILTQLLRDQGRLEKCGGAAYVTEVFDYLPTVELASDHIEILEEKLQARRVEAITTEYKRRIKSEQDQLPVLLDDLERDVMSIRRLRAVATQYDSKPLVLESINQIESIYNRRGAITGIATGFPLLDQMLDGLHPKEMVVIAARPGRGKTALAMSIAEHVAVEQKKPVGVFSLEMSARQLMIRALCGKARVNLRAVQAGHMTDRDFPAIQAVGTKIAAATLIIDDQSSLTISDIKGRARRWKAEKDIQLIMIDYLQLIRSLTKRAQENRQQEISEISAGLKGLAKELDIAVVVLAQLNRLIDHRGAGARPRLSDLRESGSIEQDADTVAFITQPWMDTDDAEEQKELMGEANLIVAKQRNGPVGDVPLTFIREYCRFESRYTEDAPEPQPYRPQPVEQSLL